MNRPIKFRVWHKGKNEWVHEPGWEPNILGECILFGEWCRVPPEELNDLEVLQFSGLKDSAGKEIYEGDIISYSYEKTWGDESDCLISSCEKKIAEVFYKGCGFHLNESEEYQPTIDNYCFGAIKIIGNIFENPELLERNSA